MTAYVSLHTAAPTTQGEHEVSYKGYARIPVEINGANIMLRAFFPTVEEDSADVATHIVIGANAEGDGQIFLALEFLPHIPCMMMAHGLGPRIVMLYPEELSAPARVIHQLVSLGMLKAADLHPKLYEAVNDELHRHKIPVMKVTRAGAFDMKVDFKSMPSMQELAEAIAEK